MRHIVWSDAALTDYLDILRYIALEDADAAARVASAIRQTGDNLADFATGHPGRVSGTYEKSVPRLPYILAYALDRDRDTVSILHVIHAARDWPAETWPT